MKILYSVAIVFFFGIVSNRAEDLLPPIAYKGFSLQMGGFIYGLWQSGVILDDERHRHLRLDAFFTEFNLTTPNKAVKLFGELNWVGLNRIDADLLEKAYVEVRATNDVTLRLGRFLSARGYITPDPGELETVHYPRVPYEAESTGLQSEVRLECGWNLLAEVTGQTGDKDLFSSLEEAVRFSKTFTESHSSVGSTVKLAKNFRAYYLDADWQPIENLRLKGAVYAADDSVLGYYGGGYLFTGHTILDHLEIHNQLDYRMDANRKSSLIWTKGVRVWGIKERVGVTIDHESFFSRSRKTDHQALVRFELHF